MTQKHALDYFFKPHSCAVVGASKDPAKPGHQCLAAMIRAGFSGELYPVNPREQEILGLRSYRSLSQIPGPLDLVVLCTPVEVMYDVLDDLGERAQTRGDVKAMVVTTAGFSELCTEEGVARQATLVKRLSEYGVRLMGPNCLGVIDTRGKVDTTFLLGVDMTPGGISFVTQSGALGAWFVQAWSSHPGPVGFSKMVSLGNMADVDIVEVVQYLGQDDTTTVIGLYLEGTSDPRALLEAASEAARRKPVIVLKTGRTSEGERAASSHTGSMAGKDQIWDGAFRQYGVLRVHTMDALLDAMRSFDKLPLPNGNRLFVITHAGGPGVYTTDLVFETGEVVLSTVGEEVKQNLKRRLPPHANVCSPDGLIDMTASGTVAQHAWATEYLLSQPEVDGAMVMDMQIPFFSVAQLSRELGETYRRLRENGVSKPLLAVMMHGRWAQEGRAIFEAAGVPTYDSPDRAVAAFRNMVRYASIKRRLANRQRRIEGWEAPSGVPRMLTETAAQVLLEKYGVRFPATKSASTLDEAVSAARQLGFPVVMKVLSPDIAHKTEVGGVCLDLRDEDAVKRAYAKMLENVRKKAPGALIEGVLVQKMVTGGVEMIVGGLVDPSFGPVIMAGSGGILTELLKDTVFRLAPVDREEAVSMLQQLKGYKLLSGFRGKGPYDAGALADLIVRLSELLSKEKIKEVELNPVKVLEEGCIAVDALISA
ncbi:MAG: acetate--CoA ligase family protein [Bacillota bacterium]